MKKKEIIFGIIVVAIFAFVSSCSWFTDENSLENLYPNEFNDEMIMTGKWLFAIKESESGLYEIIPIKSEDESKIKYLVGVEIQNGRILPGSNCNVYRRDSTLLFKGKLNLSKSAGIGKDPLSFVFQTVLSLGVSASNNEVLYYRMVGKINKYNNQEKHSESFTLSDDYENQNDVLRITNYIKENKDKLNNLFTSSEITNLDSLLSNYGLISRTKNSEYFNTIKLRIDNAIKVENLSIGMSDTLSAAGNDNFQKSSEPKIRFTIVDETQETEEPQNTREGEYSYCEWCNNRFFKGSSIWADWRLYVKGDGWDVQDKRNCKTHQTNNARFCRQKCAVEWCYSNY